MKRMLLCCACATLTLAPYITPVASGFSKVGKSVLQFVKIGVGARQVAMGEASTALTRDVNACFWNPANITGVGTAEASFTYADWLVDLKYYTGAVAYRWSGVGVFAVSYGSLNYGSMEEAVVSLPGGGNDTRTGNMFTGGDLLVGLSFSREFTDRLSIGVTAKYLQEKLYLYKSSGFAYDVGTNYDVGYNGLRLAMSAQNFGPTMSWLEHGSQEEGYDLPLTFRIGASINLIDRNEGFVNLGEANTLTIAADAIHTNDFGDRVHLGAEYVFSDLLALRAGYRVNYEEGNLSLGLGLRHKFGDVQLRLDYAYVSYQYLNSPQRLTLSIAF